eukprot:COSAG02_NODE_20400_length_833_cov_1.291553_1_plen_218_part_10
MTQCFMRIKFDFSFETTVNTFSSVFREPTTAREILNSDWQLLNPGETTPSGYELPIRAGHVKPGAVDGFDPKQIFTSPSSKYCSYRSVYCDTVGFVDLVTSKTYRISVAFQLRQEPNQYKVCPETVGATIRRETIDPHFANEELEWSTKAHGVHKLYRLLVKIRPEQTPEEKARTAREDPRWVEDTKATSCMMHGCDTAFSFLESRHHCRYCGWIVCN